MPGFELMGQEERQQVNHVFDNGSILFRLGFADKRNGLYMVDDFEKQFSSYMGVSHAVAVTSGTSALRVALEALGVGPGDEVITQSFTFVATVEAIVESGATPVVCEIDSTLNMDPKILESLITPKTKAILPVHMLGTPARMNEILAIAKKYNLKVLEDTAWGLGATYEGKLLGTIGDMGTFSFDYAKLITTGEGGMVVTNNAKLAHTARAYTDHGHDNNPDFPRWEDTRSSSGFNYRMMELQGAVGIAQLAKIQIILAKQRENAKKIIAAVQELPIVELRSAPEGSNPTYDAVVFHTPSRDIALKCREALLRAGLGTKILPEAYTWHYAGTWTHIKELVGRHGDVTKAFPQSTAILSRSVALPVMLGMPADYPERVRQALATVS